MSWTQAMCTDCWNKEQPDRPPVAIKEEYRTTEVCCMCGTSTRSGIFTRKDPAKVPYPRSH